MGKIKAVLTDWRGLVAAGAAVAALGATAAATLGGFSATIANPTNTFSSGTIQLKEGVAAATCYSTGSGAGGSVTASNTNAACAIDDLGAKLDQVPAGTAVSTVVTLTNVGNVATTTASLIAGACTASAASDDNAYVGADLAGNAFCGKVDVTISNTTATKCVAPFNASAVCAAPTNALTLANLTAAVTAGQAAMSPLAAGASASYTITAVLDSSATNADQGLTATIPLTWAINQ